MFWCAGLEWSTKWYLWKNVLHGASNKSAGNGKERIWSLNRNTVITFSGLDASKNVYHCVEKVPAGLLVRLNFRSLKPL